VPCAAAVALARVVCADGLPTVWECAIARSCGCVRLVDAFSVCYACRGAQVRLLMRALVTGATGLLGNVIAHKLAGARHEVRALVRDEERARKLLPESVAVMVGDICDPRLLRPTVADVDVLFHAAGLPNGRFRDESIFGTPRVPVAG
jgi:hypothetical protein